MQQAVCSCNLSWFTWSQPEIRAGPGQLPTYGIRRLLNTSEVPIPGTKICFFFFFDGLIGSDDDDDDGDDVGCGSVGHLKVTQGTSPA